MSEPIRVLIADDDHLVRAAIRMLLDLETDITIIGEAANGEEAITRTAALTPDVLLLDLRMPEKTGIEVITALKPHYPDVYILVLTGSVNDEHALEAIKAGAAGYLLKTATVTDLARAIRSLFASGMPLHSTIASKVIRELTHATQPAKQNPLLTPREHSILQLIARGLSNDEIASRLELSKLTVRTYTNRILRKLRINNRTRAALYALKTGLVTFEGD